MSRIQLTTTIEAPPAACFDLVLNVDVQLSLGQGTRAVGGIMHGPLQLGDVVTWRSRHFGVPWRMTSKIVVVERPGRFIDAMQQGPFARWRHVHEFQPSPRGTVMHDTIDYAAPLGVLGTAFDALVLHRYLHRLLRMRNRRLQHLAEQRHATHESVL